jgi:uncharacterized protein YndB with AHSA1/START domain
MSEGRGDSPFKLQVRRVIQAPREAVFEAWTNPDSIKQWFFINTVLEMDVRVGGKFKFEIMCEGKSMLSGGEYLHVEAPSLLEFTWFSEGTKHLDSIVRVELFDRAGSTELALTHEALPDEQAVKDYREGWQEIMEQLAIHLTTTHGDVL